MAYNKIKQNYSDIADAIRSKTGKNGLMTAEEMPAEIEGIETGITPTGTVNILSNNNTVNVASYATAKVNILHWADPSVPTFWAEMLNHNNQQTNFIEFDHVYAPTENVDVNPPSISNLSNTVQWPGEGAAIDMDYLPGGYDNFQPAYGNKAIVIGAVGFDYDNYNENTNWDIEFYILYNQHEGSEEEESAYSSYWREALEHAYVFDLDGMIIGRIANAWVYVSFTAEC